MLTYLTDVRGERVVILQVPGSGSEPPFTRRGEPWRRRRTPFTALITTRDNRQLGESARIITSTGLPALTALTAAPGIAPC
jgi:hypothetical protein